MASRRLRLSRPAAGSSSDSARSPCIQRQMSEIATGILARLIKGGRVSTLSVFKCKEPPHTGALVRAHCSAHRLAHRDRVTAMAGFAAEWESQRGVDL